MTVQLGTLGQDGWKCTFTKLQRCIRDAGWTTYIERCQKESVVIRSIRLLWRGQGKGVVAIATAAPDALKTLLKDQLLIS